MTPKEMAEARRDRSNINALNRGMLAAMRNHTMAKGA
jgi:hypothetical protein